MNVADKGEDLRKLLSVYEEVNAVLLGDFTENEAAQFFELLERV